LIAAAKILQAPELAVPRDIRVVDEIPLLGTGKTDYLRLREWASKTVDALGVTS
jgi:acyl-[acyl-carrier-protein]-phospholipid O-acyltransferase / long-chain-fatty-acid--[acyl-carrier-protein] ligase